MAMDKQALRKAIIKASLEIGSELGEEGLTMRGIAARLGVSATALYQHFESKSEILEEVRVHAARTLHKELRLCAHISDPVDRMIAFTERYVVFARQNPWMYKVMSEQEPDWEQLSAEQREDITGPLLLARRGLQDGLDASRWRDGFNVDKSSMQMWTAVHGLCNLLNAGRLSEQHPFMPIYDQDQFISDFVRHLVESFKKEGS